MRAFLFACVVLKCCFLLCAKTSAAEDARAFRIERSDVRTEFHILLGAQPLAAYVFKHAELTWPALVNVRTVSGVPVTRPFPAPANADHRWMHPGIAISFGHLDGHDYWRLKAKVSHDRFLSEPTADRDRVAWAALNRYLSEDGQRVVCWEEARYSLERETDALRLQMESVFFNDERDFYFGDQEESGLCLRVTDNLSVKNGTGTVLNDRGEQNEAGTWGREFRWIDYSGTLDGQRVGLRVAPHAENPRACWSHTRDYGVLVANPFPRQPQSRREPYVRTWVRKGERYRLRFSISIYEKALTP